MDYWRECISQAADECGLTLSDDQLAELAQAAEMGHEHYGQAHYSPPWSDRLSDIESEWRRKYEALQREFDAYRSNAETAVKQALKCYDDSQVTIHEHGEVLQHEGRTTRIQ